MVRYVYCLAASAQSLEGKLLANSKENRKENPQGVRAHIFNKGILGEGVMTWAGWDCRVKKGVMSTILANLAS